MIRITTYLIMFVTLAVVANSGVASADDAPAAPVAPVDKCANVKCKGAFCGCNLLKQGWKEIARCEGKMWEYLIEKGRKRMLCSGVAVKAGYNEEECTPFLGRITEFLRCRP